MPDRLRSGDPPQCPIAFGEISDQAASDTATASPLTYDGFTCASAVDGIRCSLGNKSFRVSQFSYEFS
ncbi:hypothetical protein [Nocardia vulneris]|uniref:hypothetical protein n=1 Tax=Nocardia vulneris TaxID=1141657 RepID=UPI000AC635F1|nr:hypothetical protein [Nocardia vulneris]